MTAVRPPEAGQDEPGGGDGHHQGSRRRRWWIAGVVIVVALALVGVGYLVLGDDDDTPEDTAEPEGGAPSLPPPVVPEVDSEGGDLLALLDQGSASTYHAVYETSGDPATIGTELTLEVWRRDGLVRQDSRQVTDSGTVETAGFLLEDDVAIVCSRVDEGDWTCARQSQASSDVFGSVTAQLAGRDVVTTEEEIGDHQTRCFSFAGPDGEISECLTAEGIPVRLRGPGTEILLSVLDDDVPEDIFEPPAEPVDADAGE